MSSQIPPRPAPDASGACPPGWVRGQASGNCVPARVGTNLNNLPPPPPQAPRPQGVPGATPYSSMVGGATRAGASALEWFGRRAADTLGLDEAYGSPTAAQAAPPPTPPGAGGPTKADRDRQTFVRSTSSAEAKGAVQAAPEAGKAPPAPTNAGPGEEREPRGDYYDRVKYVRLPGGRIVAVDADRAGSLVSGGAEWLTHEDAVTALAKARAAADPGREGQQGADVAVGSAGASFTRPGSTAVPGPAIGQTRYSERIEGLLAEPSGIDLNAPATESGSLSSPGGKTRTLSGLEQAVERRRWLEGRRDFERGRELRDDDLELRRALMEQRLQYAQLDPLAQAQIEASGRYGGEYIKAEAAAKMREMALAIYQSFIPKIQEARIAMSRAATDQERASLQGYIDQLERAARDQANLAIGAYLRDPKFDMMSMLLAGALGGAPAAPSGGGAGT